jgi:hypothetical protein
MSRSKAGALTPLREVDPLLILQRYLADESIEGIAKEYGVTRVAMNQLLLHKATEEWKSAQIARAQVRLERAREDRDRIKQRLSKKTDKAARETLALSLARVRDDERSAQWELEKLYRRIYGQDVPQAAQVSQVIINLRRENSPHDEVARLKTVGSTDESST